jgi:hypothetical protein
LSSLSSSLLLLLLLCAVCCTLFLCTSLHRVVLHSAITCPPGMKSLAIEVENVGASLFWQSAQQRADWWLSRLPAGGVVEVQVNFPSAVVPSGEDSVSGHKLGRDVSVAVSGVSKGPFSLGSALCCRVCRRAPRWTLLSSCCSCLAFNEAGGASSSVVGLRSCILLSTCQTW